MGISAQLPKSINKPFFLNSFTLYILSSLSKSSSSENKTSSLEIVGYKFPKTSNDSNKSPVISVEFITELFYLADERLKNEPKQFLTIAAV